MMPKPYYKLGNKKPAINSDKSISRNIKKGKENSQCQLPSIHQNNNTNIRTGNQTSNDFFILRETQYLNEKIFNIRNKPVKPIFNLLFLENQARLLQYKQNNREMEQKAIKQENQKYRNRINNQKSYFLSFYGKEVVKSHDEMIDKIINKPKKLYVLPKINKKTCIKYKTSVTEPNIDDIDNADTFDLNQQNQGAQHKRSNIQCYEQDNDNSNNNQDNNIIKEKNDENKNNENINNSNNKYDDKNNKSNNINEISKNNNYNNINNNENNNIDKNRKSNIGNSKNNNNSNENNNIKNNNRESILDYKEDEEQF